MKTIFDLNRLTEGRKQELDRMVADFLRKDAFLLRIFSLNFSSTPMRVLTAAATSWQSLSMTSSGTNLFSFFLRRRSTMLSEPLPKSSIIL